MALKGQGNNKKRIRNDSLIESLRSLGTDFGNSLTEDFFKGLPEDFFAQTFKDNNRSEKNDRKIETDFEKLKISHSNLEVVRHQEKLIYSSKEREVRSQVNALYLEAKKLAAATNNLSKEIKIATTQNIVDPGIYHLNFFETLIQFIRQLTKQVSEASTWISASNGRSKKKSHYWGQVNKSGSKFMLSQERYMATQSG